MRYSANIEKYEVKNENGEVILSVSLHPELFENLPQIHLETKTEVFDGPIDWILNYDTLQGK